MLFRVNNFQSNILLFLCTSSPESFPSSSHFERLMKSVLHVAGDNIVDHFQREGIIVSPSAVGLPSKQLEHTPFMREKESSCASCESSLNPVTSESFFGAGRARSSVHFMVLGNEVCFRGIRVRFQSLSQSFTDYMCVNIHSDLSWR